MRKSIFTLCALFALGTTQYTPAQEATDIAKDAAENYTIDSVHSMVIFRTGHMGISYTYGRFNNISGSYKVNGGVLAGDSINITVKADSIDTANDKRDTHLKSPDFFSVQEFPTIIFKGKSASTQGDKVRVTGTLTLHGVSKEISIDFTKTGEGKNHKDQFLQGYEGKFTIDRGDFGMKYGIKKEGDGEVNLIVALEAMKD